MLSMSMYKHILNILATYIRRHILNKNTYTHAQGIVPKLHISIYKMFCYQILHICILIIFHHLN